MKVFRHRPESSTVTTIFNFKRVMPMAAAARFGAFRQLFHHRHFGNNNNNQNPLRHASAMSNAILKNMSTTLGESSQLVDPSNAFEEAHRHYSFITVMAIMSLFILITISIVALLLGFCRKKNTVFSLNGSHDKNTRGSNASGFELDDLDMEDMETKSCKDDPGGTCYYHLSDDDDYDSDDDDDENDEYLEVDDNDKNNMEKPQDNSRYRRGSKGKNNPNRRNKKKRKFKFRNFGYYFHLNDEDDGVDDKYNFHESGWSTHEDTKDFTSQAIPKRSVTFPQLHNVLTSCIKSEPSIQQPSPSNQKLLHTSPPSQPPQSKTDKLNTVITTTSSENDQNITDTPTTSKSYDKKFNSRESSSQDIQNTWRQYPLTNNQKTHQAHTQPQNTNDTPALLHPETTHININKPNSNPSALPIRQRLKPSAFLPCRGKRRLLKSYSLHDIPRSQTKKSRTRYHYPRHLGPMGNLTRPALRQVTFKVGTIGQDTDIRVHHHV